MTVLITGASGGLGRAFALDCAERGYDMLITDINSCGLEKLKQGIMRQYDVQVYSMVCDITDDKAVDSLVDFAMKEGIKLDMLMNVAGIDFEGGFSDQSFENISRILRINIEATLRVTHKTLSLRRKSGQFYIIFVSSLASLYPMPLKATYAASKRFLLDFSIALGQELKKENVFVLALCPGGMMTNDDCIKAIEAQGFWGGLTTNKLNKVAHRTVSLALMKREIYIPGMINHVLSIFGRVLPRVSVANLIYSRWNKAQMKWISGI